MAEKSAWTNGECPGVVLWLQGCSMSSEITRLLRAIAKDSELHVHQDEEALASILQEIDPTVIVCHVGTDSKILRRVAACCADIPWLVVYSEKATTKEKLQAFQLGACDVLMLDGQSDEEMVLRIKRHSKTYLKFVELKSHRDALQKNLHELRQKARMLNEIIVHDPLTGISNRLHVEWMLEHEWQRAIRSAKALSLLMIDVDCFKEYNDFYGHQAGDQCLIEIAQALARAVKRPSDLVGRYGGEEFIVVLPETPLQGGAQIAERIRSEVEVLKIEHARSCAAPHVTVSLGLASAVPTRTSSSAQLIEQADRALYLAKKDGRNCVRMEVKQ